MLCWGTQCVIGGSKIDQSKKKLFCVSFYCCYFYCLMSILYLIKCICIGFPFSAPPNIIHEEKQDWVTFKIHSTWFIFSSKFFLKKNNFAISVTDFTKIMSHNSIFYSCIKLNRKITYILNKYLCKKRINSKWTESVPSSCFSGRFFVLLLKRYIRRTAELPL